MAIGDFVKGAYNLGTTYLQRERDKKAVERERKANMKIIEGLDFEPMYASETVPTYQRSQSPVARSYLESFLVGNNPASTFSGAPNAKLTKARQQESQNQMFGTPEQRVAAQRAYEATTPWKVETPTRKVVSEKNDSARAAMRAPRMAADHGITSNKLLDALEKQGYTKGDQYNGVAMLGYDFEKAANEAFGGDQDALAKYIDKYGVKEGFARAEERARRRDAGRRQRGGE